MREFASRPSLVKNVANHHSSRRMIKVRTDVATASSSFIIWNPVCTCPVVGASFTMQESISCDKSYTSATSTRLHDAYFFLLALLPLPSLPSSASFSSIIFRKRAASDGEGFAVHRQSQLRPISSAMRWVAEWFTSCSLVQAFTVVLPAAASSRC